MMKWYRKVMENDGNG